MAARKDRAAARLLEFLKKVEALALSAVNEDQVSLGWENIRRWEDGVKRFLTQEFGEDEAARFDKKRGAMMISPGPDFGNFTRHVEAKVAFLEALRRAVEDDPEGVLISQAVVHPSPEVKSDAIDRIIPSTRKVFIAYGHDETNALRLQHMLREQPGLEPVIMRYKPGRSRTLIEKFEDEAENCSFSFVLMTPDDQVSGADQPAYGQARPNVIFELGWFCGRLGRERVCILFKKGTKIHSDLDGVERVEFRENVEEAAMRIESELRAASLL